jgi:hypothetical protein
MNDLDHPSPVAISAGSERGFWLQLLLLLGGIALIAQFRPQIEAAATHPRQIATTLSALEEAVTQDLLAVVPALVVGCVTLLVGSVLIRRWWTGPVPVPRAHAAGAHPLRLGRRRGTRSTYTLPRDATFDHALVLGRTRSGKSQHAVSLALQDLDRGDCAIVVIDPHDELCRSFVAAGFATLTKRPVTWLSFGDGTHVPGFDLLERAPGESPSAAAERVGDLVDWLFFAGESTDHERLTNNLRLAAWACASLERSLLDCRLFLTDPTFRAAARLQLTDVYLLEALRELEETLRHDPTFAQSAVNRLANLTDNEALRRVVGQRTTFDLGAILDQRGVLLVSLDEVALGEKGIYLLAGMVLHRLAWHLKRRSKDDHRHQNPKVRIILDEAQRYQAGLLQGMVGELAGRGASLCLITQGLTQFADPKMRGYLLNNVATYNVFTIADHEAELIAKELFESRANRVGLVDGHGRPAHIVSIPEQLAEQKRLLTRQERREFVALARGQVPGLCQSFEVRPRAEQGVVEAFRRKCAVACGRPRAEVERMLQDRLRRVRVAAKSTGDTVQNDGSKTTTSSRGRELTLGAAERARSKKPGFADRGRRDPRDAGQLSLGGLESKG